MSAVAVIGGSALFSVGTLMIAFAVFVEDREAVAVALVGLGTVLVILGVLAPRLEGPLEVGPTGGLKAQLTKQQLIETAVEQGLGPAEIARLLEMYERAAEDAAKGRALAAMLIAEDELHPETSGARERSPEENASEQP